MDYTERFADNVSVVIATTEDAFELIRDDWQQLFAKAGCSPFLSWEWQSTWYRSFGGDSELFILKTYRGDQLIGILPLRVQEKRFLGMRVKRVGFIGEVEGGADYLDLIARPEEKAEILKSNIDFLRNEHVFDLVCLDSLASNSPTADILRCAQGGDKGGRFRYVESNKSVCPKIDLTRGLSTVLAESNRPKSYKRRYRKLEKMTGFEFRSITSPQETRNAFERFLQLHESRWASIGGSELSGHPRLASFQRDVVRAMTDTGLLRFDELWIEGECRSSIYGFDDGCTFFNYNVAYDQEWAKLNVGLVLLELSISGASERGNSVYDFLRGEEPYKFDWANGREQLLTSTLVRNSLPALASVEFARFAQKLRRTLTLVLPESLAEVVRTKRRLRQRHVRLSDNRH